MHRHTFKCQHSFVSSPITLLVIMVTRKHESFTINSHLAGYGKKNEREKERERETKSNLKQCPLFNVYKNHRQHLEPRQS